MAKSVFRLDPQKLPALTSTQRAALRKMKDNVIDSS
jgi:hypothetical protein